MVGPTGEAIRSSADYGRQHKERDARQMPQRSTATGRRRPYDEPPRHGTLAKTKTRAHSHINRYGRDKGKEVVGKRRDGQ